ncbi:MAG: universal stress protein [Porticoccaceae bacterium]|nr:universal stress protein [Pseudomonadales bacterium]MCP5172179.1 universal stress protein [Pseudomonadales bacterium]
MALDDKLLIVIDPESDNHPARDRVVELIKLGFSKAQTEVTLLFIVDHSNTDSSASNANIFRDDKYIQDVISPLLDIGAKPSVIISWSKDWADSILQASESIDATSVLISHPPAESNRKLTDEFWYLIRNSSVLVDIIKTSNKPSSGKILITMDLQDDKLSELNERILEAGVTSAKNFGAELHLANAYKDSSHYPDRGNILKLTGIENDHLHIRAGEPDEVVIEVSKMLNPDMLIMGATRRRGLKATLRGRKLARMIQGVDNDTIIVV